jgi:hypothetical protein
MDVIVNYWAVLGGAIFLMIMGFVWYGPLFGKLWMKIIGAPEMSKDEMARMQKEMMPYYGMQFALSLITSYVLYHFVKGWNTVSGMEVAFWIWLGFAMPLAAGSMWDTKKGLQLKKFLMVAGYQLVTLVALGWAFAMW